MKTIIYVSDIPWNDLTQRQQHLAADMADYTEVIYFSCNSFTNFRKYLKQGRGITKKNLKVLELFLLPYTRFWFIKQLNYTVAFIFLCIYLLITGKKTAVIMSHPSQYKLLALPAAGFYYDFMDDTSAFEAVKRISGIIKAREKYVISKSKAIFSSSRYFEKKLKKEYNKKVVFVPNGVTLKDFETGAAEKPEDIKAIKVPVVGFYGAVNELVDMSLLKYLAQEIPDLDIIMIGPVSTDISLVKDIRAIHFLGKKPYSELKNYLANIDVWIIPFIQNDFTYMANPVKIYEYLAAEKRVVSTYMPEIEPFSEYISMTRTKEEFLAKILSCLEDKQPNDSESLKEKLAQYSWSSLAQKMAEEVLHS